MIIKCNCTNAFQDSEHGKGNRVANPKKDEKTKPPECKCTSCGKVHIITQVFVR